MIVENSLPSQEPHPILKNNSVSAIFVVNADPHAGLTNHRFHGFNGAR